MKTIGLPCKFIVNATNWRFSPGGSGVNRAIFDAAGSVLSEQTKKRFVSARVGTAYPVPLPNTSPLNVQEGVEYVIHVLGPNMNPERPNCLNADYKKGCESLRKCYEAFLETFWDLANETSTSKSTYKTPKTTVLDNDNYNVSTSTTSSNYVVNNNADIPLNQVSPITSAKTNNTSPTISPQAQKSDDLDVAHKPTNKNIEHSNWKDALENIVLHPDQHAADIFMKNEENIVIYDAFPKAKKKTFLSSTKNIN